MEIIYNVKLTTLLKMLMKNIFRSSKAIVYLRHEAKLSFAL